MNPLQALSSSVGNATHPILLQQAIDAFGTTAPYLDVFIKNGAQHCTNFKALFPDAAMVKKGEKLGLIRAAMWTLSGFFTQTRDCLEPPQPAPLSREEFYSSLFDQGQKGLQ